MPTVRAVPSGTAPPLGDFPALEVLHIKAGELAEGLEREANHAETLEAVEWLNAAAAMARLISHCVESAVEEQEDDSMRVDVVATTEAEVLAALAQPKPFYAELR